MQRPGPPLRPSSIPPRPEATIEVAVRGRSGKPLPGIVVVARTRQSSQAAAGTQATMDQVNLQFQPRVLVVQAGTEVRFPNRDTVMHHVYSFSEAKSFELPLYLADDSEPVPFDRTGVATLGCNIHDQMLAHVLVVDTPYFGTTGQDGTLRLNAPREQIESLTLWHPEWGEGPDLNKAYDGRNRVDWQVDRQDATKTAEDALAWNEDY